MKVLHMCVDMNEVSSEFRHVNLVRFEELVTSFGFDYEERL